MYIFNSTFYSVRAQLYIVNFTLSAVRLQPFIIRFSQQNGGAYVDIENGVCTTHFNVGVCT